MRVIHKGDPSVSGLPVPLGVNKKLMEMRIRPAERDLEDAVKLVNGRVASHQQASPDQGTNANECYAELVNDCFRRIWHGAILPQPRLPRFFSLSSVYVLPFSEQTHEDFQWLKQEIESAGGEATVFRAGAVEGATDDEIISVFRKERDEDYARITVELDELTGTIREQKRGGQLSSKRIADFEAELDKLHSEFERIRAVDYFEARSRAAAVASYERCQKALRSSQNRETKAAESSGAPGASLDLAQYQGRRWVTRRNLHIDRLASAWLIKRFIDPRPRFSFVGEGETIEGGVPFDMFGAELTHQGEDCTFETMMKRFGLSNDAALCQIAEIVHDIDLKDLKPGHIL